MKHVTPSLAQPVFSACRAMCAFAFTLLLTAPHAAAQDQVICTQAETAGIDARKWDTPIPGAMTTDAVHRRVLLRFPGAARQIADALATGKEIAQAELVLHFDSYQFRNHGYDVQFRKEWESDPPNWHLVAHVLRKPWLADAALGPTYNAW